MRYWMTARSMSRPIQTANVLWSVRSRGFTYSKFGAASWCKLAAVRKSTDCLAFGSPPKVIVSLQPKVVWTVNPPPSIGMRLSIIRYTT